MADKALPFDWKEVIARLLTEKPDITYEIPIAQILHPLDAGMYRFDGTSEGQGVAFGLRVDDRLACYVFVSGDVYHVQLSEYQSTQLAQAAQPEVVERDAAPVRKRESTSSSLARLIADHPGLTLGCAALIGAVIGAACSPKKKRDKAAATGGGCGLAVGLAMVAVETADTSPNKSEAAQRLFAGLIGAQARRPARRVIKLTPSARTTATAGKAPKAKTKAKTKQSGHGIPL